MELTLLFKHWTLCSLLIVTICLFASCGHNVDFISILRCVLGIVYFSINLLSHILPIGVMSSVWLLDSISLRKAQI